MGRGVGEARSKEIAPDRNHLGEKGMGCGWRLDMGENFSTPLPMGEFGRLQGEKHLILNGLWASVVRGH